MTTDDVHDDVIFAGIFACLLEGANLQNISAAAAAVRRFCRTIRTG